MENNQFPTTMDEKIFLNGPCGQIEAMTTKPKNKTVNAAAIICHPHPLHEGTMSNKVVHTLSRAYHNQGIATVRFNYRGVGESAGSYGDYSGEIEDTLAVYQWLKDVLPNAKLLLGGFSFGAYIAANCASKTPCKHLISVAPAIENRDYNELVPAIKCPWLIIQGDKDEVVNPDATFTFAKTHHIPVTAVEDTGHFFHSKLIPLRNIVENCVSVLHL